MKRLCIVLSLIILSVFALSGFSACDKNDATKYNHYVFDNFSGTFKTDTSFITFNLDKTAITLKSASATEKTDCEFIKNRVYFGEELAYYCSDYYVADKNALFGTCSVNEEGKPEGFAVLNSVPVSFEEGYILSEEGETVGQYKNVNNYVIINYLGLKREYLTLDVSETDGDKTLGLFSEFYSNIKVLNENIANTGFSVESKVLTNAENSMIAVNPYVVSYKPEKMSFTVLDNGGFVLYIGEDGSYSLRPSSKTPSDKLTMRIQVDDISKIYEFTPILIAYDKSVMVMRFVDDTMDLSSSFYYLCYNIPFKDVALNVKIVDGEDKAEVHGNVLHFTASGYVVIEMQATFTYNSAQYVIKDRTSINISEKIVEEKNK